MNEMSTITTPDFLSLNMSLDTSETNATDLSNHENYQISPSSSSSSSSSFSTFSTQPIITNNSNDNNNNDNPTPICKDQATTISINKPKKSFKTILYGSIRRFIWIFPLFLVFLVPFVCLIP